MAKFEGTLYAVFVGADKILCLTDCSLNLDKSLIPTTNKDDGSWETHLPGKGKKKWSVPVSGILDSAGTGMTAEEILDNMIADTDDAAIEYTPDSGTSGYTGNATFSNISITAPDGDVVKFSATLTGNGALAKIV